MPTRSAAADRTAFQLVLLLVVCGCSTSQTSESVVARRLAKATLAEVQLSREEEAEIRTLVEELVFAPGVATNVPVRNPQMKIVDADGNSREVGTNEEQERFQRCQKAFDELTAYKLAAFPILIEHLEDPRQSINFRNHHLGNSVGHACQGILYFQLQDQPDDYSEYGYSRPGRDGQDHPKPYWKGTPFDDAGGVKPWLEENKNLKYAEMQIKCLQWLLEREKKIGVPDADSYFLNVLPLEIRILERRLELGEDVKGELERLREALRTRDAAAVPRELLPG